MEEEKIHEEAIDTIEDGAEKEPHSESDSESDCGAAEQNESQDDISLPAPEGDGRSAAEAETDETQPRPVESESRPDVSGPGAIETKLDAIAETEQRIFSEVREMHKLYHSEFAGRLQSMQEELEQYRKIDKGRAYDDILGAIARIYGNYETLVDEVEEPKVRKSIKYMLLDLEDLLSVYGMDKIRSSQGDKRNPRHCQILNRIQTDEPDKHDTIAKSYNAGFFIGNRTVIKELVDIYFYEEAPTGEFAEVEEDSKSSVEEPSL